ncbi:hypothetical protein AN214_03353 [Pseudoalteromonas sp. P1-9]|uniref:hypothetical protein n=1 Tax=Pseudoalteromonas sp. P1-9 TaxID=1710354 RepID=UPI0006D617F3|nr:hypothetical protein [Pseudoalteromonas sp. P1-9]KPV94636.1 hypothetical protein AN214_03353 [Pseudoalteromonas sp. P1-9]
MNIRGKSIKSVTKLLAAAKGCKEIKLAHKVSHDIEEKLFAIGFDNELSIGDYLIPDVVGKVTELNAHGKLVVRKDLPLETHPRSYYRTWQDWHGREHSGIQTRNIEMYPREYQPAFEETLHVVDIDQDKYVATDSINLIESNESRNIHLANLMLECFGSFEVIDSKSGNIVSAKVKQLHWDILPPGKYPWSKAKSLVGEVTKKLKDSDKGVVDIRMEKITKYNPDFIATGRAGFNGYFIYGFSSKGVYVLESIYLDNATYIFGNNWEQLSKLTKNQIINGEIEHKRIVHDKAWGSKIKYYLSN